MAGRASAHPPRHFENGPPGPTPGGPRCVHTPWWHRPARAVLPERSCPSEDESFPFLAAEGVPRGAVASGAPGWCTCRHVVRRGQEGASGGVRAAFGGLGVAIQLGGRLKEGVLLAAAPSRDLCPHGGGRACVASVASVASAARGRFRASGGGNSRLGNFRIARGFRREKWSANLGKRLGKRTWRSGIASGETLARYYAPDLGRWISPDPLIGQSPGLMAGRVLESGLYGYAMNNPVMAKDALGLASSEECKRSPRSVGITTSDGLGARCEDLAPASWTF